MSFADLKKQSRNWFPDSKTGQGSREDEQHWRFW